ncbi:MAG: NOP5/NOP56 family protein [Nanoarchaeota archaeon]
MTQVLHAKHIISDIVLDEHGKVVDHPSRKTVPDADLKTWPNVLRAMKDRRFFADMRLKNIELTKGQVRDSVSKDQFMIQSINSIEELDRCANMTSKRVREWAGWWVPELERAVSDHSAFARLILEKDWAALLEESKTQAGDSMGIDIKAPDVDVIKAQAAAVVGIMSARDRLEAYLKSAMQESCPNLMAIAGHLIGAKLISHAGSIKRLSELPSSTIQILGAEKALFRHLLTGAKPPKYGVIYSHPLVQSVRRSDQGKVARALADKISIAVKVDFFKGTFIGEKLRKDLEERFRR